MTSATQAASVSELEWIQLREQMEELERPPVESVGRRLLRKSKENPLVPIGVLATCIAFVRGIRAFRRGDSRKSNIMMRYRVSFQLFTIVAVTTSIFLTKKAQKRAENSENSLEPMHQEELK